MRRFDSSPPYKERHGTDRTPRRIAKDEVTRHCSRWPPPPSVEDETVSLRREYGSRRIFREDEAVNRGTIDQDPIIIDPNAESGLEIPVPTTKRTGRASFSTSSASPFLGVGQYSTRRTSSAARSPAAQHAPPRSATMPQRTGTDAMRQPWASTVSTRESNPTLRQAFSSATEARRTISPQASPRPSPMLRPHGQGIGSKHSSPAGSFAEPSMLHLSRATPPTSAVDPRRASTLPYPLDDGFAQMPDERDHQFHAPKPKSSFAASTPASLLSQRMTHTNGHATFERPLPAKRHSNPAASHRSPEPAIVLPPCPRPAFKSGYKDWISLQCCPDFDVCPSCYSSVFQGSQFVRLFELSPMQIRPSPRKIRCDFSRPFIRLAYLLTMQRRLPNLDLIISLQKQVSSVTPCPDTKPGIRTWWTVLDDVTRRPLKDFRICSADLGSIEVLLPALRGFFVPHPLNGSDMEQSCSLRSTNNNRFAVYVDQMVALHEASQQSGTPRLPDMTPFVQLVKRKLDIPECPRDNIVNGLKWFFIPNLPDFSVCPDCNDDVIRPLVRNDSDIAMRFNRTAQYLPAPDKGRSHRDSARSINDITKEASCYLYSLRMRRILSRAAQDNDNKYLAKKVKERKEKEAELQSLAQPVIARMQELDTLLGKMSGSDREEARLVEESKRLAADLRDLRDEWVDFE